MSVLAALWKHGGPADVRACAGMLRAQAAKPVSADPKSDGGLAYGSALCASAEPVDSRCGAFTLLADARLDNRSEFLPGLRLTAAEAKPLSDSRLMLLAIERWGVEAIDRFVGDFAVILWDRRRQRLSLARDFAGQRPLHFHEGHAFLAVASMAKGIHAVEGVPRAVDETRLLQQLTDVPEEGRRSFFAEIKRVAPGEVITFDRDGYEARTYWTQPTKEIVFPSHQDYADALTERLDEAVAARLPRLDTTVGTHLSSGLDSSAVTASAALQFGAKVMAFTAVPPGAPSSLPAGRFGNEAGLAAQTAASYPHIEHRLITTSDQLAPEGFAAEQEWFERSDLNLPNLDWANRINRAASEAGIKVLLTGTMGNATFSFAGAGRTAWLRAFLPRPAVSLAQQIRERGDHPLKTGVVNPRAPGLDELLRLRRQTNLRALDASATGRGHLIRRADHGTINKAVSLRWNITLADPTADRRLVDFCLAVPVKQYKHGGVQRALARTALKGRIPDAVRCETRRGLQTPHWFAMLSAAREEARSLADAIGRSPVAERLLDIPKMQSLVAHWPAQDGAFGPTIYRTGLLRGLSVGAFILANSKAD